MSSRIYRSANGKPIDMGQLLSQNEDVRAVGNMGVNARGDKIDKNNKSTVTRNQRVNQHYRKQIQNQVVDVPPSPNTVTNTIAVPEHTNSIDGLDNELETVNNKEVEQKTVTVEEMNQTVKETAVKNFKQSVVEEVAEEPVVEAPKASPKKKKTGGLASAIAKAREVEKVKLKSAKEEAKSVKGVKKI